MSMEACSENRKVNVVRRRLFVKHERDNSSSSHVSVTSQEKRSSGVFSFFKWFKKSDEQISSMAVAEKKSSLPASPNLKRNQSLSCGSLLSTATVSSFSFVNPGKYRPHVSLRQIHPGPDTDTYRNRIKQRDHLRELDKDLTLKKKYKLLGGSTTSIYHSVENLATCPRTTAVMRSSSLGRKKRKAPQPPLGEGISLLDVKTQRDLYGHRRTCSDSEAREGRRVHVKGKRKAPPPPTPTSSMNNTLSRSWRKKRPAHNLPFNMEEKSRLLHSLEKLKAHAEKQSSLHGSPLLGGGRNSIYNEFLKLESGVLKANREDAGPSSSNMKDRSVTPSSPVSPRPWYKRNKQPSFSEKFKKDKGDDWLSEGNVQPRKNSVSESDRKVALLTQSQVVSNESNLMTNDIKPSSSDIESYTTNLPKPGTCDSNANDLRKSNTSVMAKPTSSDSQRRSHNFFTDGIKHSLSGSSCNSGASNHSSRFSFFSKSSDDRRRSQVSMLANISALDKEATEIIEREHRRQKALQELENAKYYSEEVPVDHEYTEIDVERIGSNLQDINGFEGATSSYEVPEPKRASTRELISLFNAIGNVTRVTVNTAFFTRDTASSLFSRSEKKFNVNCKPSPSQTRKEVFKKIEDFEELEEWPESPRARRIDQTERRGKLRLGFGEPVKLPRDDTGNGSDDEGVTIEELEDERVERPTSSKPESSRVPYKYHRSPSPSIPTILELSEHSSATTPASTLNPASEFSSLASTPLSPHQPSAPTLSNPRKAPAIAQLVWSCPQCTLENLKWKFVCDACNYFRPFSIEMRAKSNLSDVEIATNTMPNGGMSDTSILGTNGSESSRESNVVSSGPGFCSGPSGQPDNKESNRKAPYYMSDVLKSPDKQVSLNDKLRSMPTTSIMDPELNTIQGDKNKQVMKGNEMIAVAENKEVEETRKARLAFFDKTKKEMDSRAETQTDPTTRLGIHAPINGEKSTPSKACDKADLDKMKNILRDLKNSIPQNSNKPINDYVTSDYIDEEIKPFVKFENSKIIQRLKSSSSSTSTNTTSSIVSQSMQSSRTKNIELLDKTRDTVNSSTDSTIAAQSNTKAISIATINITNKVQPINKPIVNGRQLNDTKVNNTNVNETIVKGSHANKSTVNERKSGHKTILNNENGPKINGNINGVRVNGRNENGPQMNGTDRLEHEDAIKKTNNSLLVVDDIDFNDNSLDRIKIEDDKKAELYMIKSKTILEDILVKKPKSKVSISVQTNSCIVRKSEMETNSQTCNEKSVNVPVVHEEYRIKPDGTLVTSLTKRNKIIGTGTFELIRSRDFVGIEALKTGRSLLPEGIPNHTYANVEDDTLSTSTCTSSTNCTSQVSPHPPEDRTSNLIRSKCFADFKARFVSSNNNVNTVAVNRLLKRLEAAIANGEHHKAASLAKELARLKISCSVTRQQCEEVPVPVSSSKRIIINMYVEDKVSHQGPIPLSVLSTMTVAQLKRKLEIEYDIPTAVQRWILGKSLGVNEEASLEEMGVKENGAPVFLYLVAPESPSLSSTSHTNAILGVPASKFTPSTGMGVAGPSAPPLSPDNETTTSFGTLNSAESSRASSLERDVSEHQHDTREEYIVEEFEDEIIGSFASSNLTNSTPKPRNFSPLLLTKFAPTSPPPSSTAPPPVDLASPPSNIAPPSNFTPLVPPRTIVAFSSVKTNHNLPSSTTSNNPVSASFKDSPISKRESNQSPSSTSNVSSNSTNKLTPNNLPPTTDFSSNAMSPPTTSRSTLPPTSPTLSSPPTSPDIPPLPSSTLQIGWRCPVCTLMNSPTRPGCAACDNERPSSYRVPQNYVISPDEMSRLLTEEKIDKEIEAQKATNYQELVLLERADLVLNTETFECPICFTECTPPNGAVLRECLHSFCKQCLIHTVEYNTEVVVKCPYRDNSYACDSHLQEREIKALVSPTLFELHLAKSIAQAETQIENAFHCKTPDCRGWCIFEDNVNEFRCPVCRHLNCLTCQAIHDGLNCKQYQDDMKEDSDTNVDARRTRAMLDEMVDRGEAMVCPQCRVVLMKKWGCDWLRCSMCKTEICWVTRGPRWGPNGKGDTTAGCKCGVNGVKCHPKCNYCH